MGLLLLISDALLKTYTFAVFIYLWENHRIFEFSIQDPITWILFFFAVDLCYYGFHRMAHEINVLWGAHVGHHQSEDYNLTTALRQSAFQYGFSWVFYLPLAILGCPPLVFIVLFILLKIYQFWLHTQTIQQIPLIEGVFSTPSSHRVHHAKNSIYIDRNYGGTLVIWDRLFSSWQPELAHEPCHYGTTRPLNTLNPIKANFQHWSMLAKDTLHTHSWRNKIGLWFKPTGWRPQDCKSKNLTETTMQKNGCKQREKYNPHASTITKVYCGLSFVCIVLVAVMFIFLVPSLSGIELAIGTAIIVYSLVVVNDFLEGNKKFALLEIVRVPMIFFMLSTLWFSTSTTRIINTIVMDKPATQVLAYASSPGLWPEWHSQSSKVYTNVQRPLTTGETFEEDINTALGTNHLTWVVVESSNKRWIAHAKNITNGSSIKLHYNVYKLGDKTTFKRTLDYTLPNFAFVVINALYFKSKVEEKSEDALIRLKAAIEKR
jgi:sterol desaturase/sphingolipid hydroxylase (fatty acid hydroxylase superfamily)